MSVIGTLKRSGTGSFTDVDGPVHFVEYGGDGPVMLLVHGLGGSHLNWALAAPDLARSFEVVAIDLPGFGLSPLEGRTARIDDQASLVARFVADRFPGPVVLVGNSMGGLIAMKVAADHPWAVDRLVLVDPAARVPTPASFLDTDRIDNLLLPLLPIAGPQWIRHRWRGKPVADYVQDHIDFIVADASTLPAAYVEACVEMERERRRLPWTVEAFVEAERSTAAVLLRPRSLARTVHAITAPTLLIHGSADNVIRPDTARRLAGERPDWQYVELEGIGHVPQIETPNRFVALLEDFAAT